VTDNTGLVVRASEVAQSLAGYDMVIVPGGFGVDVLENSPEFLEWLRTARHARWKVSVCTGSLLLGAVGFLQGKTATTHPSSLERLRIRKQMDYLQTGPIAAASG
jgi:cyclohexyl-isocyanide hydratase